jgi:hypothetical protein
VIRFRWVTKVGSPREYWNPYKNGKRPELCVHHKKAQGEADCLQARREFSLEIKLSQVLIFPLSAPRTAQKKLVLF